MKTYLSIGEASKLLGISLDTIRYYEKIGLMPAIKRLENGYRIFDMADLLHLKGISYLRKCGISIQDIQKINQGKLSCEAVIDTSLKKINERIEILKKSKDFLKQAKKECEEYSNEEKKYSEVKFNKKYFIEIGDEKTLKDMIHEENIVWRLPMASDQREVIEGRLVHEYSNGAISLQNKRFLSYSFTFETDEDVEKSIEKILDYGRQKVYNFGPLLFFKVYHKTSCFTGEKLAGGLLLEIKEEAKK